MKSKKIIYILAIIVILLLMFVMAFILGDKRLDLESSKVTDLYKKLGEVDIYHCGGLITYQDEDITVDSLNNENALCTAYHNYKLNNEELSEETIKSTGKNENKIKICQIGDIKFVADENDSCTYTSIDKNTLNHTYKSLYGKEIKEFTSFYISSNEACYLEGEEYYCGSSETFNYSLVPDSTVYRLISKAVEKLNGDIVIYDYYLKASDSVCYNVDNSENNECTKALNNSEIDVGFMKKYGTLYKHTFKLDSNNNHYWLKTEIN